MRPSDERHIWQQFVGLVGQYPDAPIYHYGSYEPRALATLAKRYHTDHERLTTRLVNVNQYIYGSNSRKGLKPCNDREFPIALS